MGIHFFVRIDMNINVLISFFQNQHECYIDLTYDSTRLS